jgi:hypothetical protein
MAIENTEIQAPNVESTQSDKFHRELQAKPMSDTRSEPAFEMDNPEAARILEMLEVNERMIREIQKHAFEVADRASESIERLPRHFQDEFMKSISKFSDPGDLVYHRVRANFAEPHNA